MEHSDRSGTSEFRAGAVGAVTGRISSLSTLEHWPLFSEWGEDQEWAEPLFPGPHRTPFGSPSPSPSPLRGSGEDRPWPSRGELGSGSKGEVGVRTAVGWVLSVPWSPPTGPGLGDRAEKVLDACSPGPPNNFLGHVFRVSSSPQPLTIIPGGGDGGAGVMEHSSS